MPIDLVAVLGAGGHAKVVYDAIVTAKLAARVEIRDDDARLDGKPFMDTQIKTPIASSPEIVHIAIGDNRARSTVAARLAGRKFFTVVHPAATVSERCTIAPGAFIAAGAVVAVAAQVGECAIINHGAIVDHDCVVGRYAHVAPAATLGGEVTVGEGALVGAGAVVLPGISIGKWAVVGAGAVVTRAVADGETVYGVPAGRKQDA
jgi:sugar O-acyltransferase (sialic acid O-acetyltransferase NeuD family)